MNVTMELLARVPSENGTCGFQGNSDLYGLGVRLGIYLQIFAAILATFLGSMKRLRSFYLGSTALSIATLIVLINESVRKTIKGVEIATFLWTMVVQLSSMNYSATGLGLMPMLVTQTCSATLSIFLIWFWYHGLDVLPRTDCRDEFVFCFAKVSLWHRYRTFAKVVFTASAIGVALNLLYYMPAAVVVALNDEEAINQTNELVEMQALYAPETVKPTSAGTHQRPKSQWIPFMITLVYAIVTFGSLGIFHALPAELAIHWNKIEGVDKVDSVSQLVPFVLGLGQLLDVLFRCLSKASGMMEIPQENENEDEEENTPCPHRGRGAYMRGQEDDDEQALI